MFEIKSETREAAIESMRRVLAANLPGVEFSDAVIGAMFDEAVTVVAAQFGF